MSQTTYLKYWQAVSTSATITGEAIKKPYNARVSATFTWTSTTNGTTKMQHRDREGGTWIDTPGASAEFTTQPNGSNAGSVACNWSNVPGHEIRFVFTRTNGSGAYTCDVAMGDVQEGA